MTDSIRHQLPYSSDCSVLFDAVQAEPWAMWLDSCALGGELGAFDILVARPHTTLVTRGAQTEICTADETTYSWDDPFALIRQHLKHDGCDDELFSGGAVGYFAYDLARRIESLPEIAADDLSWPEMTVGIYDWAVVCDHNNRQCQLISANRHPATAEQWPQLIALFEQAAHSTVPAHGPFHAVGELRVNMSRERYAAGVERIRRYLQEGDCYQVNFAQRFSVEVSGSAWSAYLKLRHHNPAPFSAYLNTPFGQILSSSPERFLRLSADAVETRPIKGTRPRVAEAEEDSRLIEELINSPKERAENLMIVDLLRNDLGKCCRPGTIRVPQLFALEHYATVHHLVSVIEGDLSPSEDALSLLRHAFPGGSITGAPKLRAMEIIEELEPHRRGVYCGSIGYIGHNGNMDSSITIRTALFNEGALTFSAGGGIVFDSNSEHEYQEIHHKAAGLLRILQRD